LLLAYRLNGDVESADSTINAGTQGSQGCARGPRQCGKLLSGKIEPGAEDGGFRISEKVLTEPFVRYQPA
jgi:hypothetical protein